MDVYRLSRFLERTKRVAGSSTAHLPAARLFHNDCPGSIKLFNGTHGWSYGLPPLIRRLVHALSCLFRLYPSRHSTTVRSVRCFSSISRARGPGPPIRHRFTDALGSNTCTSSAHLSQCMSGLRWNAVALLFDAGVGCSSCRR